MHHKIIIYQTLPRLHGNTTGENKFAGTLADNGSGHFSDYTPRALDAIRLLGCNHVWYTGVIRHAQRTDYSAIGIPAGNPYIIKGEAGSPYAIVDYYDVDPDLADRPAERMKEFEALVARTHAAGLKVIIDFVPNHVGRQYQSVAKPEGVRDFGTDDRTDHFFHPQNNFFYCNTPFTPSINLGYGSDRYVENPARATGNDCYNASPGVNDWYETVKLNYGVDPWNGARRFDPRPDTWDKMLHILLYWAGKGIDGFRCDMAHMVPVEFWEWAIARVKAEYPELIFIAELYEPAIYRDYLFRGGFDYLYDKVGLYDTLRAVTEGRAPASAITGCWQSLEGIQDRMLNFLENHDEQRIASDFFARDPERAIPALVVSASMNVNPFMIYEGQELGEPGMEMEGFSGKDGRTTIFDYWTLDTLARRNNGGRWDEKKLTTAERQLLHTYARLLRACGESPAIAQGRFYDLMYCNQASFGFNPTAHYAYLRHAEHELVLVVANFSADDAAPEVVIPRHAFEWLGLSEGSFNAMDLLSGKRQKVVLEADKPMPCRVAAHTAMMLKVRLSDKKKENNKKTI